ncbi:MAG: hypothetical protein UZ16_OP3001002532 [Candidatus Hinthialibacteria bacterium OLB16]|nr:MAG: hypothetical protein UZ16_OP3001002532 [Candidatus Hinthialibacteria bacterium OLB16]
MLSSGPGHSILGNNRLTFSCEAAVSAVIDNWIRSLAMAQASDRWEDNAEGPYYIDKSCSMCNLCTEIAPDNIREAPEGDHCYISRQPEAGDETTNLQDAIDQCPCEAIGKEE